MNKVLAIITLDSKTNTIADLTLEQKRFRFKCKRCATLCCKLGGPALTRKDSEQIENKGYSAKDFLEPVSRDTSPPFPYGNMKNREDGSCIFLEFDSKLDFYKCNIYEFRPLLCRLYPFSFETVDSKRIALKFIPCCRGLNNHDGEHLNEKFFSAHLLEPLRETVKLNKKEVKLF